MPYIKNNKNLSSYEKESMYGVTYDGTSSPYKNVTEKERKTSLIVGWSIIAAIIVAVAGGIGAYSYFSYQNTVQINAKREAAIKKVKKYVKPAFMTDDGAFQIDQNGLITGNLSESQKKLVKVDAYIDPLCPGCGAVERALNPAYAKLLQDNKILLRVHPITILDPLSTDKYSTRAAAAMIRAVELRPELAYKYVVKLMSADFQPHEGRDYKSVSDAKLREAAEQVGYSKTEASKITDLKHAKWLLAMTAYTTARRELYREGENNFITPLVQVEGKNMSFTMRTPDDLVKQLEGMVADAANK